jgi:hypothetical protein
LVGSYEQELRNDIVEGVDFIFLPSHTFSELFHIYKGGPRFERVAINIGPTIEINLFPIRVEVYLFDRENQNPKLESLLVLYLNRNEDFHKVDQASRLKFNINYISSTRYWIKESNNENKMQVGGDVGRNIMNGRKLTFDVTDRDGTLKLLEQV